MVRYVLDPRYQRANGCDIWHWDHIKKVYHAGGAGVKLPLYNNELGLNDFIDLHTIEMMSRSPVVLKSKWFKSVINCLEKYKTDQGTYLFPEKCMFNITYRPSNTTTVCSAFISKEVLSNIKRNERKSFAFELYSTFIMIMLKNRMKNCY